MRAAGVIDDAAAPTPRARANSRRVKFIELVYWDRDDMREEFETVLCQTAIVGDTVPLFDKADSIADAGALVRLFAEDANGDATTSFNIDNRHLIGGVGGELLGGRVNNGLGVDDAVA
jgi:hypothetical protein